MVSDRLDLVVAGAGGGIVGAIRAAQLGHSVLLVEASKAFRRGNNTSMSTAMIPGAGSRFQQQQGLDDAAATFTADVMAKTHGEADPVVTEALAEVSARLVEWLADDLGLPIELVTDFAYPGHSVFRCHTVPGRSGAHLLGMLADHAARMGLDIMTGTRLVGVERAGDGMRAQLELGDGTSDTVETGAVLLATNGFGADPELVAKHIPEISGATYHGSDQSRGDGLRIGESLGAAVGFLDAYQGHGALTVGAGTLAGWATVMHGGVIVNREGRRFADETQGYSEFAAIELTQTDNWAAIVIDERIYELCTVFDDFRQTVESGAVRFAESVEGLAEILDVPGDALAETLDGVADVVRAGGRDEFGRTHWPAEPLGRRLAAIRVTPALFHTQGGLRVDAHARVLSEAGAVIPGLYAAGGAAVGISGHGAGGYLAGNGLLSALGLAFLAAENLSPADTFVTSEA